MSVSRVITAAIVQGGGQQIATGVGLMIPRAYYDRKLAVQQRQWRSNPLTLANVRTIGRNATEYKEPWKAISVRSLFHDDAVMIFDSHVRLGFSSSVCGPYRRLIGPFENNTQPGFQWLRTVAAPSVPKEFVIDPAQRAEFLRTLGLREEDVMEGLPLARWYGFYLQQIA